jgi:glutaminase
MAKMIYRKLTIEQHIHYNPMVNSGAFERNEFQLH